MDAMSEYLIKSEDFSKILATLLKERPELYNSIACLTFTCFPCDGFLII